MSVTLGRRNDALGEGLTTVHLVLMKVSSLHPTLIAIVLLTKLYTQAAGSCSCIGKSL